MEFDITRLLDWGYYTDIAPGGDFLIGYGLGIFFLVVAFLSKIVRTVGPKDKYFKKSLKKRFGKFVFLGVAGVIFVAARFSGVPYFSMRIWLYVVLILTFVALISTLFRIKADYRKRLSSVDRETKKRSK